MKRKIVILSIIFVLLIALVGCGKSYAGKYVNENNSAEYLELNKDGTLRDYDISPNYFQKHRNLGPIILLEEIKKKLKNDLDEK